MTAGRTAEGEERLISSLPPKFAVGRDRETAEVEGAGAKFHVMVGSAGIQRVLNRRRAGTSSDE